MVFSDFDRAFMANNMKIIVDSIEAKINEPFFSEFKQTAINTISLYIDAIVKFEASGVNRNLFSSDDNEAEALINSHYCTLSESIENCDINQVFDALRHSFSCYAYNGLHQLYTRQENECWHPKIRLTEILTPNDIESLGQTITLYRGCDVSELNNNSFGQAWTTSLEVAKEFAYIDYQHQPWFDKNSRIVLETNYLREHVLFSDQSVEYEVVVDVTKLVGVRKHT